MRTIDTGTGPLYVVSTRSEAAQLWDWLAARRGQVLALDFETNALDPWDPGFAQRLAQMSDGKQAWAIQSQRPGMLEVSRTCVREHPFWVAHFAENDIRFAERGAPGSIRLDSIAPHVADTQTALAWLDPRTVTTADPAKGIDPRIRLPRGLKATAERLLPGGHLLPAAEAAMETRVDELLAAAGPDPAALVTVDRYRETLDYFGIPPSGLGMAVNNALAHCGLSSPQKTANGADSWTTPILEALRKDAAEFHDQMAVEIISAILAVRALRAGPAHTAEERRAWGFANIPDDDEAYLRYGGLDAIMTARLWELSTAEVKRRGQWPGLAKDLKLQWHIDLMTFRGMAVDGPYVKWLYGELSEVIRANTNYLDQYGIGPSGMGAAIGPAFEFLGVSSDKLTKTGAECWDRTVLDALAQRTDAAGVLARAIIAVRKSTKFLAAYVQPMLDALKRDGRVHCSMRAVGTISSRQSARDPAMQQSPKRTDGRVRAAYCSDAPPQLALAYPEDWAMVSADLKQGEPRVMAAMSGDNNLLRDINSGDINAALAVLTYGAAFIAAEGKDPSRPSYHMRQHGKVGFLADRYGGGDQTVADALGVPVDQSKPIRERWAREYFALVAYERKLNWQPAVILESGWVAPLWDRYFVNDDGTLVCGKRPSRLGLNYDTQGNQRNLLARAVHLLIDWGWSWALLMLIHDEIVGCVPKSLVPAFSAALNAAMTTEYHGVPILCDVSVEGRTWMPQEGTGFDLSQIIDEELDDV